MENVKALLDRCKTVLNVETDAALAARLGLRRERISDYYKGNRFPNNDVCMIIAERTGMPLAEVIAAVEIDSAKDENQREAWRGYLKSIGGIAASFMLMVFASVTIFVTSTENAHAKSTVYGIDNSCNTNYATFRLGFWLRRLAAFVLKNFGIFAPRFGFAD